MGNSASMEKTFLENSSILKVLAKICTKICYYSTTDIKAFNFIAERLEMRQLWDIN